MRNCIGYLFVGMIFYLAVLCNCQSQNENSDAVNTVPAVIRTMEHDTAAFTQGLLYDSGLIYESTGLYGKSTLRILSSSDGSGVKKIDIQEVFAEGLALVDSVLVMLTWKEGEARTFSKNTLERFADVYSYEGEGWGLTHDGSNFIMSNGSDTLYIRDRQFNIVNKIPVIYKGNPLVNINELEWANGFVYANVWYSDIIFVIDTETGRVVQAVDCGELVEMLQEASSQKDVTGNKQDVLNGIAFNRESRTFYLTGKKWPLMFEVRIPAPQNN